MSKRHVQRMRDARKMICPMAEESRSRRHHWLRLGFVIAIAVADQISKYVALRHLELHRPVPLFPTLDLMLTYNTGAAFSFLSDAGGWQRWLFVGLAIAISAFLLKWLFTLYARERWLGSALVLVLGGAIGNLIDRLFRDGKVVDFIYFHYQDFHFPAFNLADSAICVGAALLIAHTFFVPESASS
jgi:signal peptidase II